MENSYLLPGSVNGISKDILDKKFQPFFKTKPTGQG